MICQQKVLVWIGHGRSLLNRSGREGQRSEISLLGNKYNEKVKLEVVVLDVEVCVYLVLSAKDKVSAYPNR